MYVVLVFSKHAKYIHILGMNSISPETNQQELIMPSTRGPLASWINEVINGQHAGELMSREFKASKDVVAPETPFQRLELLRTYGH